MSETNTKWLVIMRDSKVILGIRVKPIKEQLSKLAAFANRRLYCMFISVDLKSLSS